MTNWINSNSNKFRVPVNYDGVFSAIKSIILLVSNFFNLFYLSKK
jgi:hypothetical protein